MHYALKRNGHYVNPLNQNFPRTEPLPKSLLSDFRARLLPLAQQLDAVSVATAAPRN